MVEEMVSAYSEAMPSMMSGQFEVRFSAMMTVLVRLSIALVVPVPGAFGLVLGYAPLLS